VFTTDIKIEEGWAILGDKPGLGIEIDREALMRQAVEQVPAGAGPSPYGRRPGAGLYEVLPSEEERAKAAKGAGA
jgi:hypothetical protein